MRVDTGTLSLFGLDLEPLLASIRLGWHGLLWGPEAGVRRFLDARILASDAAGEDRVYVGEQCLGKPEAQATYHYRALIMPSDAVLFLELAVPAALEHDLEAVVELEARASSPFVSEDTCYGWRVKKRGGERHLVSIAILARSDATAFLRSKAMEYASLANSPELWCQESGQPPIVVQGFGEAARAEGYRGRLRRLSAAAIVFLVLLAMTISVPAATRHFHAQYLQDSLARIQREATPALSARESLLLDNERVQMINTLAGSRPDHYAMIAELTVLTPDSVYLESLSLEGDSLQIRGWARNAAAYIQSLAESTQFDDVRSLSGIRRHGRTQLELFSLQLRWSGESPVE